MTRKQILDQFYALAALVNVLPPNERLATLGEMESYLAAELEFEPEDLGFDFQIFAIWSALRREWKLGNLK